MATVDSAPVFANPIERPLVRIGELSRRVGVRPGTIRAWERRYGLLSPVRTESGYRLYSARDEAAIRTLTHLRSKGVATARAARLALEDPHLDGQTGHGTVPAGYVAPSLRRPAHSERLDRLRAACESFDGAEVHAVLDRSIGELSLSTLVEEVVMPALRDLGERWREGEINPAQEHFASAIVRGRLIALGRGWGTGSGPIAVLACPAGERHDIPLVAFGLLLRERGWRIVFLGQDTPEETLGETADAVRPDAVVIAATEGRRLRAAAPALGALAGNYPVWLAGPGASGRLARRLGARHLEGETSWAAKALSADRAERTAG